jgi:hypothetical protein
VDDRARLARYGGVRRDMAMAERVARFLVPLAGRLRRDLPDAEIDLEVAGDPVERAVLSAKLGSVPDVNAWLGYEAGAVSGAVSVEAGAARKRDLEKRLKDVAAGFPEVAAIDPDGPTLRFSAPPGDARLEEIAFLLLREAGRALSGLAR